MRGRSWALAWASLLLLPILPVPGVLAMTPDLDPRPLFSDGFQSGPSADWTFYRAKGDVDSEAAWSASDESLVLTADGKGLGAVVAVGTPLPEGDWEIRFRYRASLGVDAGHGVVLHFGRGMDAFAGGVAIGPASGFEVPGAQVQGYGLHFDTSYQAGLGDAGSSSTALVSGRIDNYLEQAPDARMGDGRWHQVDVTRTGTKIVVHIDGDALLQQNIGPLPDSGWGFSAATDSRTARHEIDDVRLLPLRAACMTVLRDDFNGESIVGPVVMGYTAYANWLVSSGYVDLHAGVGGSEYEGLHAGFRSTTVASAGLHSKEGIWILPGTLVVRYALSGGGGTGTDLLTMSLGPLEVTEQVLGTQPWRRVEHVLEPTRVDHATLTFEHAYGTGGGVRIDDIEVLVCNPDLAGCVRLEGHVIATGMVNGVPSASGATDANWQATGPGGQSGFPRVAPMAPGWTALEGAQWVQITAHPVPPMSVDGQYEYTATLPQPSATPRQTYVAATAMGDDAATLTVAGQQAPGPGTSVVAAELDLTGPLPSSAEVRIEVDNAPAAGLLPLPTPSGVAARIAVLFIIECAPGSGGLGVPEVLLSIVVTGQVRTCNLTAVAFVGVVLKPGVAFQNWAWVFGDGQAAGGQATTHDYQMGTYRVELLARPNDGFVTRAILDIDVMGPLPCDLDDLLNLHPDGIPIPPPPINDTQQPWRCLHEAEECEPKAVSNGTLEDLPDSDGDGWLDRDDTCPQVPDPKQMDMDGDLIGDVCDGDMDGDGVPQSGRALTLDNCPQASNPEQTDQDEDGFGDACDEDFQPVAIERMDTRHARPRLIEHTTAWTELAIGGGAFLAALVALVAFAIRKK